MYNLYNLHFNPSCSNPQVLTEDSPKLLKQQLSLTSMSSINHPIHPRLDKFNSGFQVDRHHRWTQLHHCSDLPIRHLYLSIPLNLPIHLLSSASGSEAETTASNYIYILPNPHHWHFYLCTFFLMNSQPSNERKQQPSSFPSFLVNKRAAIWFGKPSFFRFKLKSRFLPYSRSSSKSRSSLSSDSSLSCAQLPSTTTSKDSIYASTSVSNQAGVSIKKSSKVGQTLDAVSSKYEAPIALHSSRLINSTAPQTTPDYRQPIPNFFATIPTVPGVSS